MAIHFKPLNLFFLGGGGGGGGGVLLFRDEMADNVSVVNTVLVWTG